MSRRLRRAVTIVAVGLLLAVGIYAVRHLLAPHAGGDLSLARSAKPGLRVLFVGNSLTFKNDLPKLVHELADADRPIFAVSYTAPAWTLRRAARNQGLESLLREVDWDVVVLQEQSRIPAERPEDFVPAAAQLDRRIRATGARTVLFLTWGYRRDYADMQQRLMNGYSEAARRLHAEIAPVGLAWAEALRRRPGLALWARDGQHPSRLGSYLAACVFYATLTRRDPRGDAFTAGLPDAAFLQGVAWDVTRTRY